MPSFLQPLTRADAGALVLRNARTGQVVANRLLRAFDSASRRTGLLRHTSLEPGEAMVIAPCNSIHTFFMRFAIDVAFVSRDGVVLKVRPAVDPWRIAWGWGAHATIEMAAGAFSATGTVVGDPLELVSGREP